MGRRGAGLWRYDTIEIHVSVAITDGGHCLGGLHVFTGGASGTSANAGGKPPHLYRTSAAFSGLSPPEAAAERKRAALASMAAIRTAHGRPRPPCRSPVSQTLCITESRRIRAAAGQQ